MRQAIRCTKCRVSFYRRNLPHWQRDNKPHFITFVTRRRLTLPDWAREMVLSCCRHDHEIKYILHAAVVMPDHVHLILTPKVDKEKMTVFPLFEIMKAIKSASAHLINRRLCQHGAIWQEESFDRVLRSSEKLEEKVAYILQNPVRWGQVEDWQDYRWLWYEAPASPYTP